MAETTVQRPPFDPELEAALGALGGMIPSTINPEMVQVMRQPTDPALTEGLLAQFDVEARDVTIPGYQGDDIVVTVFTKRGRTGTGPGFYHTHGGGMIIGDRFGGINEFLEWIVRYNGVLVSVEYRLAPEFPDPYPVEDCYAGLVWTAEHAIELGIDLDRLVIGGASAGGGLAAGTTLLARDRRGPKLAAQLLIYPMIDDRNETVSSYQIQGEGVWDRTSNDTGWDALLGDRRHGDDVSIYAAPSRATDLTNLPPAFIDVGTAEVFRDEDVAYASAIWAAGGQAELHVWPGAFHGCDMMVYHAQISIEMRAARDAWIRRQLG